MEKQTAPFSVQLLKYSVALILPALLLLSACKDAEPDGGGAPVKNIKVSCLTISRAQLKNWVDSGWTKPGSPGQINEIVLQFFAAGGSTNLQLIGYPGNSPVSVRDNGKITLAVDTTCKSDPFSKDAILGNNIMKLDSLGIFDKNGNLNPFDYIRLTPEQQYPPYVNFKVTVITNNQTGTEDGTRPCPVWCD